MKVLKFFICVILLVATFSANADASSHSLRKEIDALKVKIDVLEKKLQENDQKTLNKAAIFNGFNVDKKKVRFDGRIQVDAGNIVKGKTSDMQNDIAIRRAWFGFGGEVDKDWHFRGLFSLESEESNIVDAFINYKGIKDSEIWIGHFIENNGLDANIPNMISPLMERSAAFTTFRKMRRVGASYNYYQENYALKLGAFGSSIDKSRSKDNGQGVSGRAYILPIHDYEKSHHLHIGFNGSYRSVESDSNSLKYDSSGNSWIINDNIIDSGDILGVSNHQHYASEIAYQNGPFLLVGEYFKTIVNRKTTNLNFDSSYIMASYFLTGQRYKYDFQNGGVSDVINKEGALEVASRYSYVNLNDNDIRGGKLRAYDVGVNYYVNKNVKLMLNYTYNKLKDSPLTDKNPQHVMGRVQLWF